MPSTFELQAIEELLAIEFRRVRNGRNRGESYEEANENRGDFHLCILSDGTR